MAKHTGKDGVFKAGPTPTAVGHMVSWTIDEKIDVVRSEAAGQSYADKFTTIRDWSGSVDLEMDHADAGQDLLVVGDTIAVELYSEGDASGKEYYSGNAIIQNVSHGSPSGGMATRAVTLEGSGALTKSTVA